MQSGGIIHFSDPIWRVVPPINTLGKPIVETRNPESWIPSFFQIDADTGANEIVIPSLSRLSHLVLHSETKLGISSYQNPQQPNLKGLEIWDLNTQTLLQQVSDASEIQALETGIQYTGSETNSLEFVLFSDTQLQAKVLNSNVLNTEIELYPQLISLLGATVGTIFHIIETETMVIVSYSEQSRLIISAISESDIITLFQEHFDLPLNAEIILINGYLIAIPNPKVLLLLSQ